MSLFEKRSEFIDAEPGVKKPDANSIIGKDLKAYCSRCKMDLTHTVITATKGNKPDKVRCNTCNTERTYKAPKGSAGATKRSSTARKTTTGVALPLSLQKGSSADLDLFETQKSAFETKGEEPVSYSPKGEFSEGDTIMHVKFGMGFVLKEAGLNKVEVLFEEGRKLLIHKK